MAKSSVAFAKLEARRGAVEAGEAEVGKVFGERSFGFAELFKRTSRQVQLATKLRLNVGPTFRVNSRVFSGSNLPRGYA